MRTGERQRWKIGIVEVAPEALDGRGAGTLASICKMAAGSSSHADNAGQPRLKMPAFSRAMSTTRGPSTSV